MASDPRPVAHPDAPPAGPAPALVLSDLPRWGELIAAGGPLPDPSGTDGADAAGLQLLASLLLRSPGRLALSLTDHSPLATLWRRLGLDDPSDAEPVMNSGRLVALRLTGTPA